MFGNRSADLQACEPLTGYLDARLIACVHFDNREPLSVALICELLQMLDVGTWSVCTYYMCLCLLDELTRVLQPDSAICTRHNIY